MLISILMHRVQYVLLIGSVTSALGNSPPSNSPKPQRHQPATDSPERRAYIQETDSSNIIWITFRMCSDLQS